MIFKIHSIGDSAFLEAIMNAVAMLSSDGDLASLAQVGLLLGILIIFFQSVFQGAREVNISQIFVCWLIYAMFFVPKVTVSIHDAYTGQDRPVDNVPIGVAAAGSIISEVGYQITKKFETAFGLDAPHITTNRFAESLQMLNDVRRQTFNNLTFQGMNQHLGGGHVDMYKSWSNYIRECSLVKLDLEIVTLDEMMTQPIEEALKFDSQVYGTRIYTNNSSNGQDLTCTEAWADLMPNTTTSINSPETKSLLNKMFKEQTLDTPAGSMGTGEIDAWAAIGDGLHAMEATSTTTTKYVMASVIEPIYQEMASGRLQDLRDFTSALMINQAIHQRNVQWAGEQTLFMSVVRPMMTFFEGFIYAVTPIMAFIIVLGGFGIGLAGKYLQTLIWIQLWMPVLAIINLFIYKASAREMASYTANGLDSLYSLNAAGDVLQNWIATAGMLAAATPIISLFIVTGSTYTFTTLASRIGGADHVDEKVASPDLLKRGPVAQMDAAYSGNETSGFMETGTMSTLESLNISSGLSQSVASAEQKMNQASQTFGNDLSSGFSDAASSSDMYKRASSLGGKIGSMRSEGAEAVKKAAGEFMRENGISNNQQNMVRGAFAMAAGGQLATAKKALHAGLQASGESASVDSKALSQGNITKLLKSAGYSETDSAKLNTELAESISNESTETMTSTWGHELGNKLSASAQKTFQAGQSYTTQAQMLSAAGKMQSTDVKTLGGMIARNEKAQEMLNNHMKYNASPEQRAEREAIQRKLMSNGVNPTVASNAAAMSVMTSPEHNKENIQSLNNAFDILSAVTGVNYKQEDPYENRNIKGPDKGAVDDAASQAERIVPEAKKVPNQKDPNSIKSDSQKGHTAEQKRVVGAVNGDGDFGEIAKNQHQQDLAGVADTHQQHSAKVGKQALEDATQRLLNSKTGIGLATQVFGMKDNALNAAETLTAMTQAINAMPQEDLREFIALTESNRQEDREKMQEKLQQFAPDFAKGAVSKGLQAFNWGSDKAQQAFGALAKGVAAGTGAIDQEVLNEVPSELVPAAMAGIASGESEYSQKVLQQASENFEARFQAEASSLELTPAQRDLYAAAHAPTYVLSQATLGGATGAAANNLLSSVLGKDVSISLASRQAFDRVEAAKESVREEFATPNENGVIERDDNGRVVLNEQQEQIAQAVIGHVTNAPRAGAQAANYISRVTNFNAANKIAGGNIRD